MPTVVLPVTADSFIASNGPDTNYDSYNDFSSGESDSAVAIYRALVKFNGLSNGTIPQSAIVESAIIRLTVRQDLSSNARIKRFYRLKRNWVESQVTWNVYSTGNNWQTAGMAGANDRESTDIGALTISANPAAQSTWDWTLDPGAIKEIVSGAWPNYGFALITDTENNDGVTFYSRNDLEARRPILTVVYTLGPPGVKTINGRPIGDVKTWNGVDISKIKSVQGLT